MNSNIDFVSLAFSIICALLSVYLLILGIRRIRGQYTPYIVDYLQFNFIKITKGMKAAKEFRKKSLTNKYQNLFYGISALVSVPIMLYLTYLFLEYAWGN